MEFTSFGVLGGPRGIAPGRRGRFAFSEEADEEIEVIGKKPGKDGKGGGGSEVGPPKSTLPDGSRPEPETGTPWTPEDGLNQSRCWEMMRRLGEIQHLIVRNLDNQETCRKKHGRRGCQFYDVTVRDLEKEAMSMRDEYRERDCDQYREGVVDQIILP